MTAIILSSVLVLSLIVNVIYFLKTKKFKLTLKELDSPLRYGYYKTTLTLTEIGKDELDFEPIVYVNEIDRYTNGKSKIQISSIDPGIAESKVSRSRVEGYIKSQFKSLVDSSEIDWLESESAIKEQRRTKLEKLKKVLK